MYNRQALKQRAKRLIGWGNPAMFLITLVYVCLLYTSRCV